VWRDSVYIGNRKIGYNLHEYDPVDRQPSAPANGRNTINVFLPGHGLRAATAQRLLSSLAKQDHYQPTWSIDIDPSPGGSTIKAQALVKILERLISARYPSELRNALQVKLFGWSQGGSEAMLAAALAPERITGIACLCSTGLVDRSVGHLTTHIALECARILTDSAVRRNGTLSLAFQLGLDVILGVANDVVSTRSAASAWKDVRDAAGRVCGADFDFSGDVVLIFAENDTAIRWRDAFPECKHPKDVQQMLPEYQQTHFPQVRSLQVDILPGNHLAPEADAEMYIQAACKGLNP